MKILMPFPYLEIFDRYLSQMRAISNNIDEFHIIYCSGRIEEEWKDYFIFHKFMDYPYNPKKVGWKKSLLNFPLYLSRLFLSKRFAYRFLKYYDFDLYYVLTSYWQQDIASYLAKKTKKPYVCRVRGNIQFELEMKQPFFSKNFYTYLMRRNLLDANLIIPITRQVMKTTIHWGIPEDRFCDPIGLGVNPDRFYPMEKLQNKTFTVGFAGRLSKEKGVFRLIKLAKQLPDIRFHIVGRKQEDLIFPKNVKYLGRIPHDEMVKFYNNCDLIVLPSFSEGFPNVIIEAYACERRILATPEAFPEEVKCFGVVAPFYEWCSILPSFKNKDVNVPRARKYVENNWTWERFGESITSELNRVIKSY